MRTDETLLLQALKLKQRGFQVRNLDSDFNERLIEQIALQEPEETKEKLRNICAFIPPDLFDDVDNVCQILSLSKRQIVEMALLDMMEKAHKIINETEALKASQE